VGSAAVPLLITVPVGLGIAMLGARVLQNYGWGLFVALPFTMGFAAALVYGIRQPRSLGGGVWVARLSVLLLGGALLALAALGGVCGYRVQKRRRFQNDAPVWLSVLLVFAPGVEIAEHTAATPSPTYVVRTAIEVSCFAGKGLAGSSCLLGDSDAHGSGCFARALPIRFERKCWAAALASNGTACSLPVHLSNPSKCGTSLGY
jgi:hypothetical protein